MDRINNMMENMSELSDEQIVELQNEIISEFESVESEEPTPQTVEAMTSLADMLDSVRSEVQRREVQAAELADTASEASARVHGEEVEAATEQPEETDMTEPMPEDKTDDQVETETPVEDVAEGGKEEEKPVMASADPEEAPEADEASTAVEEVIELSTEPETEPEAVEEAAVVEDAVELSAEEIPTETPIDAPVEVQEEAPVTAAANDAQDITPEVPADRRPASMTSAIPVAITAGADIPGVTAGTELSNMSDVADAFAKRLHGLRRVNGGDGEQHIVASFSTQYPEAFQLGSDAEANMEKIKSAPTALTASGSYQSPFATRYEIFGIGSNVRPVRDAFPSFQADRGGIRYIVPPSLGTNYANAVGVWTTTLDTAYVTNSATSSATKQNLVVTAATETTAVADAVTLQMQFGNLATRAYPELIARHNELGLIQHAREAEENILSALTSASTAVTSTNVLGLGVDFLLQVGRAAAQYRARHRMADDAQLRVIAPAWVKAAIRSDFALQMPGDGKLSVTDSEIDALLGARGVNVTWHLDDANMYASQGASAMNEFYDSFVWYIFAEGTFLFLDGGTLDLGVIRDSTLVGTNDYKMFVETFEGIAKIGVESLKVTSTISVNGARSALRDTLAGTASATVEF